MADVNDWWSGDPAERFWLVNEKWPGADDEGEIIAPRHHNNGKLSTYDRLCQSTSVNDIVLHYWNHWTKKQAIMWWSRITSAPWQGELDKAYTNLDTPDLCVPALGVNYRIIHRLDEPITLEQLRDVGTELRSLRDDLQERYGNPIYFPWQFTRTNSRLQPRQTYLSKLPAAAVSILEGLGGFEIPGPRLMSEEDAGDVESSANARLVENERVDVRTQVKDDPRQVTEAERRSVIEQHGVNLARQYFVARGYRVVNRKSEMPYHLEATKMVGANTEVLHVAVKGSSSNVTDVSLTVEEVRHDSGDAERVLFVVDGIDCDTTSTGIINATGGHERVWWPWSISAHSRRLTPLSYRYELPAEDEGVADERLHRRLPRKGWQLTRDGVGKMRRRRPFRRS